MNDLTAFIYLIFFVSLCGATFAFMWRSMGEVYKEMNKPKRKRHPEMEDVKSGDELLVFRVEDKEDI